MVLRYRLGGQLEYLSDGNPAHMMDIFEPAPDNFPAGPDRSSRTNIWKVGDEFYRRYDYELQLAMNAAYVIVRDLAIEPKALLDILYECTFNSWSEVIKLFGERNEAGVGVGPVQTLCRLSPIVQQVLHDQFVCLDAGVAVCCLLFTWQKYAGLLGASYDCIFLLTYDKDLSDVQNAHVPEMTLFQRRIFDHLRSAPPEV